MGSTVRRSSPFWTAWLSATFAASCASSTPAPDLVGAWVTPGGYVAGARTLTISPDGAYAMGDVYAAPDGLPQVQVETGTIGQAVGGGLLFAPDAFSCAGAYLPPYVDGYTLSGGTLRVIAEGGATNFVASDADAGAVATGCYTTGQFVPAPVAPFTERR